MCKEFNSSNLQKDSIYVSEYKFSKNNFFDEKGALLKDAQVLSQDVVA